MDIKKLNNFREVMEPMIEQDLEGLLYDLNLLPEQLKTECDGRRYAAVVNLYNNLEKLKGRKWL